MLSVVGTNASEVNFNPRYPSVLSAVGYQVGVERTSSTARRRRLATGFGNSIVEDRAEARRKLASLRRLITEQQHSIDRQRELITQLESETPNMARLRSAREALRLMIESYHATLQEATAAQEALAHKPLEAWQEKAP